MTNVSVCELCGEPMPPGEEMFKFHGYSGPCPKPPKPKLEVQAKPPPDDPVQHLVRMIHFSSIENQMCKAKMCLPGGKPIHLFAVPEDLAECFKNLYDLVGSLQGDRQVREIYQKPEGN